MNGIAVYFSRPVRKGGCIWISIIRNCIRNRIIIILYTKIYLILIYLISVRCFFSINKGITPLKTLFNNKRDIIIYVITLFPRLLLWGPA